MIFEKKASGFDDPVTAHEMRIFTRRETDIRPYRNKIFTYLATGIEMGGNPVDFLKLALEVTPIPAEIPLDTVTAIKERDSFSTSIAECLDDLGIMRPFELNVLHEAESLDRNLHNRESTDQAIRLIAKYHQWRSSNSSSSELADLFSRMSILSVFFPRPLITDAIKEDPFLLQTFGKTSDPPRQPLWQSMADLGISKFYIALIKMAEAKGKLAKAFELLADIEKE